MNYVKPLDQISLKDVKKVGGKNASLGYMIQTLSREGVLVPHGFALTADAYWYVIEHNKILEQLQSTMKPLASSHNVSAVRIAGKKARRLIEQVMFPEDLEQEITDAYHALCKQYHMKECDVAVRSSATAEDSPEASFAGQQETFLNVTGAEHVIHACKKSMASLFTDRAIVYRLEKGFDHFSMAISVGIQKMVRADLATSGVMFSIDTESGFKDSVLIDATYGLGEMLVQGKIIPDEYCVYKPMLVQKKQPIVKKKLGAKTKKYVYANRRGFTTIKPVAVSRQKQQAFCLTDTQILQLAEYAIVIEKSYTEAYKRWMPMDIEWAQDGRDGKLYILQARPETIHSQNKKDVTYTRYELESKQPRILAHGTSIGQGIATGTSRVIRSSKQMHIVKQGDIIVTRMTDPDWVPVMKKAAAIITESGGATCHAAIVSRELGIPALVGVEGALQKLKQAKKVTVDCSQGKTGYVYQGAVKFIKKQIAIKKLKKPPVDIMINLGVPDRAYALSSLPVAGVGLARIEFIITDGIKVHPMALLNISKMDVVTRKKINTLTAPYTSGKAYFIERLSQEVGTIAAAFYPRPVLVRFSDFKSNEYRNLIGGEFFEPIEANPMLGLRGASRYYSPLYKDAFVLECAAMRRVREVMGFDNVHVMVPFVRTVKEAREVLKIIAAQGLERSKIQKIFMMCELPANVHDLKEYVRLFDGFSIGSNDLTQLTLGIDRDSELVANIDDENNTAVLALMEQAIATAKQSKSYIGICGQAPSDHPEIARNLIKWGIDSLSLNPDAVLTFLLKKY
ncbi:phosphoenolpyruvate synthase [Candidatus Babeliales bacterium]|nr:phosphoenolpyruvate synthase [Candidatus Babeliales bacterium]